MDEDAHVALVMHRHQNGESCSVTRRSQRATG
jgi:hypothetical protein